MDWSVYNFDRKNFSATPSDHNPKRGWKMRRSKRIQVRRRWEQWNERKENDDERLLVQILSDYSLNEILLKISFTITIYKQWEETLETTLVNTKVLEGPVTGLESYFTRRISLQLLTDESGERERQKLREKWFLMCVWRRMVQWKEIRGEKNWWAKNKSRT